MKSAIVLVVALLVVGAIATTMDPQEQASIAAMPISWSSVRDKLLVEQAEEFLSNTNDLKDPGSGCHFELGATYNMSKPGVQGCSYVHYAPNNGRLQFINQNSPICADTDKGGKGGVWAVQYDNTSRLEYTLTGTSNYVWSILTPSACIAQYAPLPVDHDFIIGLQLMNKNLYLMTLQSLYVSTPGKFQQLQSFTVVVGQFPAAFKVNTASLVTSNGRDLLYVLGVRNALYSYSIVDNSFSSVNVAVTLTGVTNLFYSDEQTVILETAGHLYRVAPSTGAVTDLGDLIDGYGASTLYRSVFYTANATHVLVWDIANNKRTVTAIVGGSGTPILGNFVFFA